jgi:DNA-binding NtrC family response regulator
VELKLQVEELRRRVNELPAASPEWIGEVRPSGALPAAGMGGGIEPRETAVRANEATIRAGMSMADVERAAIEVALRETRGNRRKAAEMLQIGERTLYRKLREYQVPVDEIMLD